MLETLVFNVGGLRTVFVATTYHAALCVNFELVLVVAFH